jgi:NADP-dependent 3-hydroxy acid dehydrogenase YdfG
MTKEELKKCIAEARQRIIEAAVKWHESSDPNELRKAIKELHEACDHLDILVNK